MSSSPICIGRIASIQGDSIALSVERADDWPKAFLGWEVGDNLELSPEPPTAGIRSRRFGRATIVHRAEFGAYNIECEHNVRTSIPGACAGDWIYILPRQPTAEGCIAELAAKIHAMPSGPPVLPIGQSFALVGRWRIYFNRHGASGRPWCVAPDAGGWEVAVSSVNISAIAETVYRPKPTPDDEDGRPSAWICVDGYLTVHLSGHASIGNP